MARQPAARPPRQRGRLLAVLTALPLVLGLLAATAPPARSATASGYDISWPQCPVSAGGFGLPMPPTTTPFVVVGLTKGLPFTQNPCLADQVGWGKTHGRPAQAYTMAAFPTAAQLSAYRSNGPVVGQHPGRAAVQRRLVRGGVRRGEPATDRFRATGRVDRRRATAGAALARRAPHGSSGRTATSSRA